MILGYILFFIFFNLIPSLLVGYLAERFDRSRFNYTAGGILLGWPFVLTYLLIVGRHYDKPVVALSESADRARRHEHALKRQGVH